MFENRFQSRFSATAIIFLSVIFLSGCQTTKTYQETKHNLSGDGRYTVNFFLKDVKVEGKDFCAVRAAVWNRTNYKIKYLGAISFSQKEEFYKPYELAIFGHPTLLRPVIPILMPGQQHYIKGDRVHSRAKIKKYPNLFSAAERNRRVEERLIAGRCDPYYEKSNVHLCRIGGIAHMTYEKGKVISPCFQVNDKSGNVKAYEEGSWRDEPIIKLNILPYDEYHKGYQKNTNDTGKWLKIFKPSKGGFWTISPY